MSWSISAAASWLVSVLATEAIRSDAGGSLEQRPPALRVLVIGTSGSGKSTFAGRLAARTGIPHLELDLINWRPGWYDRHLEEPLAFMADVAAATVGMHWVIAGGYSMTRPLLLPRLTDIVWLDLPHWRVMVQVIRRSVLRAASGQDVFPGCREDWPRLLQRDHPIRYAWSTHRPRRVTFGKQVAAAAALGVRVHQCTNRRETDAVMVGMMRDMVQTLPRPVQQPINHPGTASL